MRAVRLDKQTASCNEIGDESFLQRPVSTSLVFASSHLDCVAAEPRGLAMMSHSITSYFCMAAEYRPTKRALLTPQSDALAVASARSKSETRSLSEMEPPVSLIISGPGEPVERHEMDGLIS